MKTIDDLVKFLKVPVEKTVKTLVFEGKDGGLVAFLLRGDHQLNEIKVSKLPQVASAAASRRARKSVRRAFGAGFGSLGPIFFAPPDYPAIPADERLGVLAKQRQPNVTVIVDRTVAAMTDFGVGANEDGQHYVGVNWGRDVPEPTHTADLRNVVEGDPSPSGNGKLKIVRGIEVGHIFQLGKIYSEAMKATVLDESGKSVAPYMGCYGIGVTRIVAAAIEQNHDERGIIWPEPIAPFHVVLVPIGAQKSDRVAAGCRQAVRRAFRRRRHRSAASTTAMPARASSSQTRSSSAFRTGVVVGERGVEAASSNIAAAVTRKAPSSRSTMRSRSFASKLARQARLALAGAAARELVARAAVSACRRRSAKGP